MLKLLSKWYGNSGQGHAREFFAGAVVLRSRIRRDKARILYAFT